MDMDDHAKTQAKASRRKRIPKRFFVYGVLLVLIALSPFWNGPRPSVIVVRGSARELGMGFGRKARTSIRLLLKLYVKRVLCRGPERFEAGCKRAAEILAGLAPEYREELQAMAEGAKVDPDALMLGNCFLDLGIYESGCRTIVLRQGEKLLHGHNLDWDDLAGLANWTVCIVRRYPDDGRHATVSVGFPGLIGALDIANEQGLALSFNQLRFGDGTCTEPVLITLRRIAERCSTFAEARQKILAMAPGMSFIITLSDAKTGQSAVFERSTIKIHERLPDDGLLTSDNVAWGDQYRSSRVQTRARELGVTDIEGIKTAFADPAIMLSCNLYSVIFDHHGNRLYLASGRTPAAVRPYRGFDLFPR